MNFDIKVSAPGDGLIDYAGDTLIVSKRRLKMFDDLTGLWKKAEPAMRANFREVWAWGQTTWDPLSPRYAAYKKRMGYSPKKNIRTGKMFSAIRDGQVNIMEKQYWVWGIDTGDNQWYESPKARTAYPIYATATRNFMILTKEFWTRFDSVKQLFLEKIFKRGK